MSSSNQARNPAERKPVTVEKVRELFNYDPDTGLLTNRVERNRNKIGQSVGTLNNWGRLICRVDYTIYYVHRIIWLHYYGTEPPTIIDHINGKPHDNRICNLREADHSQNIWNSKAHRNSKSGLKGAHYSSIERKWRSSLKLRGECIHLGWFRTKEEAHSAYAEAAKHFYGEFARIS